MTIIMDGQVVLHMTAKSGLQVVQETLAGSAQTIMSLAKNMNALFVKDMSFLCTGVLKAFCLKNVLIVGKM